MTRYRLAQLRLLTASLFLSVCYLLSPLLTGCNGGSGTTTPPPVPTFETIDVPGSTVPNPGGGTFPNDINDNGDIAGAGINLNNMYTAFVRSSAGVLTPFQAPDAGTGQFEGTTAVGINTSGTVIGYFGNSFGSFGFIRYSSDGYPRTLSHNPSTFISPGAINDPGDVAGVFQDTNATFRGFLQTSDGTFTAFDVLGAHLNQVFGLTAADEIIGSFSDSNLAIHGFLRAADGTVTQIDAPGATGQPTTSTVPFDINAAGTVVGTAYTASGSHSFVRTSDGSFTVFDPPNTGALGSHATGINASGAVVGGFWDANSHSHGFIRNLDGTFVIIDVPNATYTDSFRINNSGQIVGTYIAEGSRHGYVRK